MMDRPTRGRYEPDTNILHVWYEQLVELDTPAKIEAFFTHVENDFVRPCPKKPYLLVSYDRMKIPPTMTEAYGTAIAAHIKPFVIATYRYQMPANLTGVAVSLGNARIASNANIFPDEATARAAIERAATAAASTTSR